MDVTATAPIGVFDSGVGGLSVLRALLDELPHERFIYVADSGFAPYGTQSEAYVVERSLHIAHWLVQQHQTKALVVACNTATAAAIEQLRQGFAHMPLVGMEPPIKPAAALSRTGVVGVLATRVTLASSKFQHLLQRMPDTVRYRLQPCDGLVEAIERHDATKIRTLCAHYTGALGQFGLENGAMDTLVLGCTHYPFVADVLRDCVGPNVRLIDAGQPVARHTHHLLGTHQPALLATFINTVTPRVAFYSSGDPAELDSAVQRWLGVEAGTSHLCEPAH